MTSEDLAGLMILLEEHGIMIDIDPVLLLPNADARPLPLPRGQVGLPPVGAPSLALEAPDDGLVVQPRPAPVPDDPPATPDGFSIDRFVYAMAIGLVIVLLAWAAWSYILH
jgi:hypothetical protein